MQTDFTVKISGFSIVQSSVLPEDMKDYYLPGSECIAATGIFGKIILQKVRLEAYRIYYALLTIEQDVAINLFYPEALCISQVLLRGSYEAVIQDIGRVAFRQHTFSLLYHNHWNISCSFSKGNNYVMLVIGYPAAVIEPFLAFYPGLEQFQKCIKEHLPVFLQHGAHPLSAGITELIYQLLQVPFIASTRRFHVNNIQAIITAMCKQLNSVNTVEPFFSLPDIAVIHATKEFIDTHLDTHYTISQLARKMGINEHKLKRGFKTITGVGVFGYLLQQRLVIAKAQLEQTNKSIREIARKAGYSSSANFSIAFKKKYGISPSRLKKDIKTKHK